MEEDRTAMEVSLFSHAVPILPVRSLARALAFYDRLGFRARRYEGGEDYAFLTLGPMQLHLRFAADLHEGSPCGVYLYLAPGSAAALQQTFREAGVEILSPLALREWKMNEFMLSDPDGNLLRFGEPTSPDSSSSSFPSAEETTEPAHLDRGAGS